MDSHEVPMRYLGIVSMQKELMSRKKVLKWFLLKLDVLESFENKVDHIPMKDELLLMVKK